MKRESSGGLFRNRNWRYLWFGQGVSQIGDYVFDITLVLWVGSVLVRGKPWAPEAVSGILIAAAVPVLVVGPAAGVYVDRWNRQRTMLIADIARAVLVASLLVVPYAGHAWPNSVKLTLIYVVTALVSAIAQFFNPSRFAIIASVVEKKDQAQAFGLVQATSSVATVIGPPLAAPLLFGVGVQWALVVNALSYVASFVTVALIRPARQDVTERGVSTFWSAFKAGIEFFRNSPVLMALLLSLCVYTLGVGALNVLDIFFVTANLHVAASWLGVLSGAFGIGSVIGALSAGLAAKWLTERRLYWIGMIAIGLLVIAYSRSTDLGIGVAVLAFVGLPVGAVGAMASPLVLQVTPQEMLGRVSAVINPMMQLAGIIAMAAAGFLASTVLQGMHVVIAGITFGRIDTIFGCSGLLMAIAGLSVIRPLRQAAMAAPEAGPGDETSVPTEAARP